MNTETVLAQEASIGQRQRVSRRRASWLRIKRWSMAGIHWKNFIVLVLVPLSGLLAWVWKMPALLTNTMYFTGWCYAVTTISINILYHRYLSHQSIEFSNEAIVHILAIVSSGGGVTHALNWCSAHRSHHRYCDKVDSDPHSIRRGWFFSHIGWMILVHSKRASEVIKQSKLDELNNERIVYWQAKNYSTLMVLIGLIVPTLICGVLWDDYYGGFVYAGVLKMILVQHSIFCVNSIGHSWGNRPYNDETSARDNILLSLITWGEGNQNFHHEFPMEYRNGVKWYSYDPTKWAIWCLAALGQIDDMKSTSQANIDKSFVQQQQKLLDSKRSQLNWGISIERLPVFSHDQFRELARETKDRYLVVISGIIHDVTPFAKDHPGGVPLMQASHGKDATAAFEGAVYAHSNAARNLLATMRIGALGGSESIYWKQQRRENKLKPLDSDSEGKRIVRSQATKSNTHAGTAGAA